MDGGFVGFGLANNEEFLQIFCDKNVSAGRICFVVQRAKRGSQAL